MLIDDYRRYYIDLTQGVIAGNYAHFQITMEKDDPKREVYENYQRGLTVLALVSLIESNFLDRVKMKALRKFETVPDFNTAINQEHLSCYIYLRDCYAHNPFSRLLNSGSNTEKFKSTINSNNFPFSVCSGHAG